jgi:hypothetical protein
MNSRIGEVHRTNEGYNVEIIEYFNAKNCTVRFEEGNVLKNIQYDNLKRNSLKNPFHKSVYGIGFKGTISNKNIKKEPKYILWNSLFFRCYSEKHITRYPSYYGCSVSKEWHNFQNFSKWYNDNYIEGFHLDKDILIKGNKIYGPDTCCFVPEEINYLFEKCKRLRGDLPIGVSKNKKRFMAYVSKKKERHYLGTFDTKEEAFHNYKIAKEDYIKKVADKWKDKINTKVYQAIQNYKVEITD